MTNWVKKTVCAFVVIVLLSVNICGNCVIAFAEDQTSTSENIDSDFVDNEIIVLINPTFDNHEYTKLDFLEVNCVDIEEIAINSNEGLRRVFKLTLLEHSKQNVLDSIRELEQREDVYSAEPNYSCSFAAMPNEPWVQQGAQWAFDTISLYDAWDYSTGSSFIKVGVIDSGINANQFDLTDRIDRSLSKCFSGVGSPLEDSIGHGTGVASIIGAQGNNGVGLTGVCWNISLVSLRVDNSIGKVDLFGMMNAVVYAEEVGIPILNCSVGYNGEWERTGAFKAAISGYSGLFVCAAGNDYVNVDMQEYYPGRFCLPNVITVGASDISDNIWVEYYTDGSLYQGSNYGRCTVDIFAPGQIIGIPVNNSYDVTSGSSVAAPFVTGVAALMLSVNPNLEAFQLKKILMDSVDVVYDTAGNNVFGDLCVSGGRLNAFRAVYNSHPHDYYYVDEYCHSFNCDECELSIIEDAHNFAFVGVDPSSDYFHIKECICGYSTTEYHSYTIYVNSPDAPYHYAYCGCGDYELDLHVLLQANSSGVNYDWYCMYCGITYVGDYPSLSMSTNTTVQLLTESGSYVLSNGVIVLSNEDAALVEAGLLDPYELVENITVPAGPGHVTE